LQHPIPARAQRHFSADVYSALPGQVSKTPESGEICLTGFLYCPRNARISGMSPCHWHRPYARTSRSGNWRSAFCNHEKNDSICRTQPGQYELMTWQKKCCVYSNKKCLKGDKSTQRHPEHRSCRRIRTARWIRYRRHMKVEYGELKDNSGEIRLFPESIDDLWHLRHLINIGDLVFATTFRSVDTASDKIRPEKAEKRPVRLVSG